MMKSIQNRANTKDGRIAITAANMVDVPAQLAEAGKALAKQYSARRFMFIKRSEKDFRWSLDKGGLRSTYDVLEFVDGGAIAIATDSGKCTATTRGCKYLYIYQFN